MFFFFFLLKRRLRIIENILKSNNRAPEHIIMLYNKLLIPKYVNN